MSCRALLITLISLPLFAASVGAQQPAPATPQDRVAAIKQSLQSSMAALRQYEWVETTVVSLKGEEKSTKLNRCYYGLEGKVEKVPIEGEAESGGKKPRGLRGKVAENKKEEISDSMKEAIELVKLYVPPDPARIQSAKDAGRLSMTPPDAQGKASVVIRDYLKAGDSLTIEVDAAANRLKGLVVSSYTDKEKHAVALKVTLGAMPDGAVYPANIQLDVKEESLSVAITNGGYRKASS